MDQVHNALSHLDKACSHNDNAHAVLQLVPPPLLYLTIIKTEQVKLTAKFLTTNDSTILSIGHTSKKSNELFIKWFRF